MTGARHGERGQTTVELALALPFVAVVVLALAQIGLVVRDQVLVAHATREAARAAAVHHGVLAPTQAAVLATPGLDPARLRVHVGERGPPGSMVEVRVTYVVDPSLPLVGALVDDVDLQARAAMRVEQ